MKPFTTVEFISVIFFITIFSIPHPVQAWSEHHLITEAILKPYPEMQKQITVTSFADLLKNLNTKTSLDSAQSKSNGSQKSDVRQSSTAKPNLAENQPTKTFQIPKEFNESLQIRKEYEFAFKADEKIGKTVSIQNILAIYSDEPDWGMDKELFGPDQYPELWKKEYAMMGGTVGTASQAFRHMYWREWDWRSPINTLKLPLSMLNQSMGEAHHRAQLFFELSRKARQSGQEYWAWRFLANAFHYVEDVAQPFHSSQTPTKKFILMPFFDRQGSMLNQFVYQVTQLVSYYHFAFEDYLADLMKPENFNQPDSQAMQNFLHVKSDFAKFAISDQQPQMDQMVIQLSRLASQYSDKVGRASIAFFPAIEDKYVDMKPGKIVEKSNSHWWSLVLEKSKQNTSDKKEFFEVVEKVFAPMGTAISQTALYELSSETSKSQKIEPAIYEKK